MHTIRNVLVMTAGLAALLASPSASAAGPGHLPRPTTPITATTSGPPAVTVAVLSRGSIAQPFSAATNRIRLKARQPIDVVIAHLTFPPGATGGWHRHPGPTVVTVTVGSLTTIDRDCVRHVYAAGQSFVEPGSARHAALNTSTTTTETMVTFFVPAGTAQLSTPATSPRRCLN